MLPLAYQPSTTGSMVEFSGAYRKMFLTFAFHGNPKQPCIGGDHGKSLVQHVREDIPIQSESLRFTS